MILAVSEFSTEIICFNERMPHRYTNERKGNEKVLIGNLTGIRNYTNYNLSIIQLNGDFLGFHDCILDCFIGEFSDKRCLKFIHVDHSSPFKIMIIVLSLALQYFD